jgi:hypothetical protein
MNKKNSIQIKITLLKQTDLNKRRFPINFEIYLNPEYAKKIPFIICKTNFAYPSIFDNRNLFNCLCKKWDIKKRDDIITNIITIIYNLPNFVETYNNCVTNYQLLYIPGEFSISNQYNVNDFLLNNDNSLFKIKTNYFPNEPFCYFIITDINYLLLFPSKLENMKQWASIFYIGLIFEIENFKILSKNKIENEQNENDNLIENEITFEIINKSYVKNKKFSYTITTNENNFSEINSIITEKNNKIETNISMIIPNYIKENEYKIEKDDMESMKELVNVIKSIYKANKENNIFGALVLTELFKFISALLKENGDEEGSKYYEGKKKKYEII